MSSQNISKILFIDLLTSFQYFQEKASNQVYNSVSNQLIQ